MGTSSAFARKCPQNLTKRYPSLDSGIGTRSLE